MSSYDQAARDAETRQQQAKGEESFLSFDERRQLQRMLSFPEEFPAKFKNWLKEEMSVNGTFTRSQIQGLSQFTASSDVIVTPQGTTSTSYADLATVGPQLTGLSDGTYVILFGASVYGPTSGNDFFAYMSISANGATPSDDDRAHIGSNISAASNAIEIGISRAIVMTVSNNNNNSLVVKYKASSGDNPLFSRRWMIALKVGN